MARLWTFCQDIHKAFAIQMVSQDLCAAVIRHSSSAVSLYSAEIFKVKFASLASHIISKCFPTANLQLRGYAVPL